MKSDLSGVATQYAQAIFDLAEKDGKIDRVLGDLQTINLALQSTPDFGKMLGHPSIPASEKKKIIVDLFKDKSDDLTMRLVEMLADRRRLEILPALETSYHQLLRDKKGIVVGTLVSAEPLDDKQRAHLESELRQKLGKQLELNLQVDSSLIGGYVLRIGDQVIDGSLKGRLQAIERSLLSV
jgi:F-type H+-transporting ATPase subunit delta